MDLFTSDSGGSGAVGVITAGPGATVATAPMFGGKDLADVSGPNGVSMPDARDFAAVAGATVLGRA
jgi:hypothetical protein